MPPAAAATKNVFDGLAMPTTLDTRPPMFAGPMLRHRKPARSVESSVIPPPLPPPLTPVVTVTLLGAGRCGRGSVRCGRRAVVVSDGCGAGFGGGAGGFCEKTGVAMKVRTANAAHGRENMTASGDGVGARTL